MPQREPLSAALFGALAILAGIAAGWLAFALDAVVQGGVGALIGMGWQGIALVPPFALPRVAHATDAAAGVTTAALYLLTGPTLVMAIAIGVHAALEAVGAAPWLRVVAFQMFAFTWLRLPLLLLAAAVPGGAGPLAALYERLGEPESGRWAAAGLALLTLWVVAGLVAGRAVQLAREWMRADSAEFRRRLVRVFAGYPFVVATAAYAATRPAGPVGWLVVGLAGIIAGLSVRTR